MDTIPLKKTYYDFKLQALTDLDGYICRFCIISANSVDRLAVWNLVASISNVTILADKGYISKSLPGELKQEQNINFIPIKQNNTQLPLPKHVVKLIGNLRRRIETTFFQLA